MAIRQSALPCSKWRLGKFLLENHERFTELEQELGIVTEA